MSSVVSATTRFFQGNQAKRDSYLTRAGLLLGEASSAFSAGKLEDAVELSYQAALRTAGAYLATARLPKKRRQPGGAWGQLAGVDDFGDQWANKFRSYSTLRSRLITGLPVRYTPADVRDLLTLAGEFLDQVEGVDLGTGIAA
ncbi:SAV_6107 family HEPN domain-containing protein [Staphylococcus chromogenes]|nr:SAV_6107 family HEPN domain-containing protein [Staphylococcus chromogenes]